MYGCLVLLGVVVVVFFLFQGFGDPARLVLCQAGESTTINNIRKELALDQPTWKQFVLYLIESRNYGHNRVVCRIIGGCFFLLNIFLDGKELEKLRLMH